MTPREHDPFAELVRVMDRLRSESGCPWDREQDHQSLKPYLLEEAYEVLEAIDADLPQDLCQELGDLLLQVVFHAQVASEGGGFTIDDVCRAIVEKLIRRHPHVFGEVEVSGSADVLANWERIKQEERRGKERPNSLLAGVPKALPALLRAQRIQSKASKVGFDWDNIDGALEKVDEEVTELRRARQQGDEGEQKEEFGDLLFALVNAGRFLDLCPEDALRQAVEKFERRFRAMEAEFERTETDIHKASLQQMDQTWDRIKASESSGGGD